MPGRRDECKGKVALCILRPWPCCRACACSWLKNRCLGNEVAHCPLDTLTPPFKRSRSVGGALALEETSAPAVLLSGGTDGIDGPTEAAGAWATPDTAERARAAGCDPEAHLDDNNAYPLFDATGQLLQTGPTHTNVMDVHVGLVHPDAPTDDSL